MKIKRFRIKLISQWYSLSHDILFIILDNLYIFDYKSVSSVCRHWRAAFKNYCSFSKKYPNIPNKEIPWLLTRESRGLKFYIPLFPKTYKIDLQNLSGVSCLCSKDGWLLLEHDHGLRLLHMFTKEVIDLPELDNTPKTSSIVCKTTFGLSAESKRPSCVMRLTTNSDRTNAKFHAWKSGSSSWATGHLSGHYVSKQSCIWLWDENEFPYYFTDNGMYYVLDYDLRVYEHSKLLIPGYNHNRVICENELFLFGESEVHEFKRGRERMDERKLIRFTSGEDDMDIGVVVRNETHHELLGDLKKKGCQISESNGLATVYDYNPGSSHWTWVRMFR